MMNDVKSCFALKSRVAICFWTVSAVSGIIVFTGCATPEVRDLQRTIERKDSEIDRLKSAVQRETREKEYHQRRESALEREKLARIQESMSVSRDVRTFTETVVDVVQRAAGEVRALDYHGYEIISRPNRLSETRNVLLVDLSHRVPANGLFVGARAYIRGTPARLRFCLLRGVENNRFEIAAVSEAVAADTDGAAEWTFSRPVIAREGHYIGVLAYDGMPIPYDDVGTGNVAHQSQRSEIKIGDRVDVDVPAGRHTKAFSFGLVGYYD